MRGSQWTLTVIVSCAWLGASAPSFAGVDQSNRASIGNLAVGPDQTVGQTFVVGVPGLLTGIEFAPLLDTSDTNDQVRLELFDELGQSLGITQSLGSVSISAENFQPGTGGMIPAPSRIAEPDRVISIRAGSA